MLFIPGLLKGRAALVTGGGTGICRAIPRRAIAERCPLGRMATTDEVATAAVFLCSDAAAFITGATVVVDGGLWLSSSRVLGEN